MESRPGADRRAVALYLTTAGREVLQERCRVLGELVDSLSPAEQAQLDGTAETLLHKLTTSMMHGGYICRSCDEIACPQDRCPVHQTAVAFSET